MLMEHKCSREPKVPDDHALRVMNGGVDETIEIIDLGRAKLSIVRGAPQNWKRTDPVVSSV